MSDTDSHWSLMSERSMLPLEFDVKGAGSHWSLASERSRLPLEFDVRKEQASTGV